MHPITSWTIVQEDLLFRKFGCNTLEDLMYDIRAILGDFEYKYDRRGTLITIVACEKIMQLERTVRTQKKNTTGNYMVAPKVPP